MFRFIWAIKKNRVEVVARKCTGEVWNVRGLASGGPLH